MKKSIIIFVTTLAILSLLIFSFTNWNSTENNEESSSNSKDLALKDENTEDTNSKTIPNLYYGVDSRFAAAKKEDVHNATSIYAFLNDGEKQQIEHINSVDIIIIKDNQQSEIR
jgi:hypothetical protein